jgi:hypothetical protein
LIAFHTKNWQWFWTTVISVAALAAAVAALK